jgi:hypothetical protein
MDWPHAKEDDEQPSKATLEWNPQEIEERETKKQLNEIHSQRSWKKLE